MVKKIKLTMALRAWDFIRLLDGVKPINGKWVYALKINIKGNFIKAKAR